MYQEPTRVIVTSDDASLPDGCHPRQVAGLVISFVNAFNSGDQASLSRIFFLSEGPSPPDFADRSYDPWSWYTVSEVDTEGRIESGFVTYDQGELLRYFAKRHRKGEQLRLLKISLTHTGLLGHGLSNKMIARELHISEHTVKFHISSIYAKLGVSNRAEAVSQGAGHGLISL